MKTLNANILIKTLIAVASVSLVGLTLYTAYFGVFPDTLQRGSHLMLILCIVYLSRLLYFDNEYKNNTEPIHTKFYFNIFIFSLLLILSFISTAYLLLNFEAINNRYGAITNLEVILASILVIILFDACRRTIGWPIVILAGTFVLYGIFGSYLPEPLGHRGYSISRISSQLYLGGSGIFGTPLGVSATFVTGVVVLGVLLEKTGAGQVMMDIAIAATGKMRGGPAKAAVIGSSLMGMISGTAVANVLTTGPISIPLMKKSGYRPEAAGAIEAVASTGGQLMPPVMGAAAFIMAEFTNTSYLVIAKAAFLPAVVFYAVLFAMVHFEAVKQNIPILRDSTMVTNWSGIIKFSYLLIPLPVFISMLLAGYSIMLSSFWAIMASIASSYFSRSTALNPKAIIEASISAANAVIPVALACAAAGVIIGIITLTGIGLKFSSLVISLSDGNLLIALILTMISCLILGMGLPTAAAYILVATLVAPALVNLGVSLLAAHLFVLYSAMLSSITPPVALAAYAAASVANANPLSIALLAVKFGIAAFFVPFFFVYDPSILAQNVPIFKIILSFITTVAGGICASIAITGYFILRCNFFIRIAFAVAAVLFISSDWITDIVGAVIFCALIFYEKLHIKTIEAKKVHNIHLGEEK